VFDKDGDGKITKEELGVAMRSLGTGTDLYMLDEVDDDGLSLETCVGTIKLLRNVCIQRSVAYGIKHKKHRQRLCH